MGISLSFVVRTSALVAYQILNSQKKHTDNTVGEIIATEGCNYSNKTEETFSLLYYYAVERGTEVEINYRTTYKVDKIE